MLEHPPHGKIIRESRKSKKEDKQSKYAVLFNTIASDKTYCQLTLRYIDK